MTAAERIPSPTCRWCDTDLIGCIGVHADWMHRATRRERCDYGGTFAAPLTVSDLHSSDRSRRWRYKVLQSTPG